MSHASPNAESTSRPDDLELRLVGTGRQANAAAQPQPANQDAPLKLALPFSDHCVLQCDMPLPVWGEAQPGSEVEVTFAGLSVKCRANAAGHWRAVLAPLAANAAPQVLSATAGGQRVQAEDVLVGEVWVASGQSNMELTATAKLNELAARADFFGDSAPALRRRMEAIADTDAPEVRYCLVRPGTAPWKRCVGQDAQDCSLVALPFALRLHQELKKPVGIVNTAYGCASIEAYLPLEEFKKAGLDDLYAEGEDYRRLVEGGGIAALPEAERDAVLLAHCRHPRFVFCRMYLDQDGHVMPDRHEIIAWHMSVVKPGAAYASTAGQVAQLPVRGALWYQGETNLADQDYALKQRLLVERMRRDCGNPDMPFLFVQVAPHPFQSPLTAFWKQQYQAAAETPNSAIVTTVDTPPPEQLDYHPTTKDNLGERLARLALNHTYGRKDIVPTGPSFQGAQSAADGAALRVTLRDAQGLHTTDGAAPKGFEVAGADGIFVAAQARILEGNILEVSAPEVAAPQQVRYAWHRLNDGVNVVNGAGLPLFPFDTSTPNP